MGGTYRLERGPASPPNVPKKRPTWHYACYNNRKYHIDQAVCCGSKFHVLPPMKLNYQRAGFTLVELMIVVGIIVVLAGIAIPSFLRGRKRSQATRILEDLRLIDSAIDQYALETNKAGGATVRWTDLQKYLKKDTVVYSSGGADLFGNFYTGFSVDSIPKLSGTTFGKLSDAAPSDFWSPFYP